MSYAPVPPKDRPSFLDRVFCPKICLFKTDGWHFGTEFLATQKTSIFENYCHFKLCNYPLKCINSIKHSDARTQFSVFAVI